ncbi:hypothetical protein AB1Y20_009646 [Prymnesium parvum]|uniref:RIIa domain-containing protein n=1 Tax=Prymnesium parvum TaxID=97485 RepID=A0AB34K2Q1_PRYPA
MRPRCPRCHPPARRTRALLIGSGDTDEPMPSAGQESNKLEPPEAGAGYDDAEEGLSALVKERPENPVEFLAAFLLQNNPQKTGP